MKKKLTSLLLMSMMVLLCSCGTKTENVVETQPTEEEIQNQAREEVLEKWSEGTAEGGYLEDMYEKYPEDEVIAHIYYYSVAKEFYGLYEKFNKDNYLRVAEEYSAKIDPNYSGEYADEIHEFVSGVLDTENSDEEYSEAKTKENKYNSLTNSDKKKICEYIQERYDYYDSVNGGYSGDKYSDTIMQEAASKYGLTVSQIEIIWMNLYSY